MKDIAADATGAAKVVAERSMGSEMDGVRRNVRWREWIVNPTVEFSGFGEGIRAVIAEMDPSCNLIGIPINMEVIAWIMSIIISR
jgi:hypothetical protein